MKLSEELKIVLSLDFPEQDMSFFQYQKLAELSKVTNPTKWSSKRQMWGKKDSASYARGDAVLLKAHLRNENLVESKL